MVEREVAWRVFAGEFNDSTYTLQGEEERAPSYLVSPLGAKMNRVFAVGVITDLENLGTPAEPLWRARLADPTGTFFISAGQFQPEAAVALSKIKPPAFAAVIGKIRTYSPEEGMLYVSIRPEVIRTVDEEIRDYWVLESVKALKERLEAYGEGKNMHEPSVHELAELGYSKRLAEGIVLALEEYGEVPVERYQRMLHESLAYLMPEHKDGDLSVPVPEKDDAKEPAPDLEDKEEEVIEALSHPEEHVPEEEEPGDDELTDDETKIIELIDDLDKEGTGIEWTELESAAKKAKLKKEVVEEAVMGLLDKGLVYEPVLGKIRKI